MMSMGPLGPPLGLAADVMGHGWLGLELGFGLLTLFEEWSRSEIFHPDRMDTVRYSSGICSGLFGEGGSVRNKSRIENSVIFIDNWR